MKTIGKLSGKVVVVTGSASGIGRAIALEFCSQGAKIVLNGRNPLKLMEAEAYFKSLGYDVIGVVADVTLYEECEKLVNTAKEAFGKVDVMITNAGISMREKFNDLDPQTFKKVMDSQILGSAFPIKAALPEIIKAQGSIVFISSVGAMLGLPTVSAYCAAKMALCTLAESLRVEMVGLGVHVGVMYVSFTANDAEKQIVTAGGKLAPVASRPKWLVQSQLSVAKAVARCVYYKQWNSVLSVLGKFVYLIRYIFPRTSHRLVCWWYATKRPLNPEI